MPGSGGTQAKQWVESKGVVVEDQPTPKIVKANEEVCDLVHVAERLAIAESIEALQPALGQEQRTLPAAEKGETVPHW